MSEYPGMISNTGLVILIIALFLIGYETYLLLNKKEPISIAVYKFGKHSMAVVFIIGFLMGHFFWWYMKPNKQIKKSKEAIQDVMQSNLAKIADSIIGQVIKKYNKLSSAQKINAIKDVAPKGINAYKSDLKASIAVISSDALNQARSEVPNKKKVKLMENEHRLLFGEFENLPPKIRKRINTANQLLIGTQIADLEKAIFFQFNSSVASEKPVKEIESDMNEKAEKYILGNSIQSGAGVIAANTVNEARNAFFFEKEVLDEIEAFQFMNEVPNAQICKDLAGRYFPKDDPNAFRYTGPLHYNCDSWMRPVLKIPKDVKVERLVPTKKGVESIQFSESIAKNVNMIDTGCNCCFT